MKKILVFAVSALVLLLPAGLALAHAIVSPDQVGVAAVVDFSLAVPSERPMSTTAVKLAIPQGLSDVTPFVKPGWQISVKKSGDITSEIDWSDGSIPAGQKDVFLFSAQVPPQATTLDWKAYQTYQGGAVVSWDQDPQTLANPDDDSASVGPYSTSQVIDDLSSQNQAVVPTAPTSSKANAALAISIAALALAVLTMALNQKNRSKDGHDE